MTGHPARAGRLWLPVLGEKVLDAREWGFPDPAGPRGFARLRVWAVPSEGGAFAVLTETGTGMSISAAAYRIYWRLREEYPQPFGVAELHPAGRHGPLHLDLVQPSSAGGRVNYIRLFPTGIGGTVPGWNPDIAQLWMAVNGEQVLEP